MFELNSPFEFLLIWPCLNFFILSVAYALNSPSFIIAKKTDGSFNLILMAFNLPWLWLTWFVFRIQKLLTKEDFSNNIEGTSLWISSRPLKNNSLENFSLVVDLTAEFTKDKHASSYLCIPNLDACAIKNKNLPDQEYKTKNVLIHCANGHGRSSTYAAHLMVKWGLSSNIKAAFKTIESSRKLAIPNKIQQKWAYEEHD